MHTCVGNPFLDAGTVYEVAWGLEDGALSLFLVMWYSFLFSCSLSPKYMSKEVPENE